MGLYDKHADSPDRLKIEGQEITLKFKRNGDGTATISWDIPTIAGCDPDDLAYDGIVITVSGQPANYISTSPQKGVYYKADPTFDGDMFSGDMVDVASVVGAFYHDRSTTSLIVTDVADQTPYYVSGYAVDQTGNYYREGVHAYSLPTGQDENIGQFGDTPAYHDVQIDTPDGIRVTTKTGLSTVEDYSLRTLINDVCYDFIDLPGSEMQTYADLAATINKRFKQLVDPIIAPEFPNTGLYRVDVPNQQIFQWDGSKEVEKSATFIDTDPSLPILGAYWFKPSTGELRIRDSAGWTLVTAIIEFPSNPSQPADSSIWLDKVFTSNGELDTVNTSAWEWCSDTWCKQPIVISTTNPLLPPVLSKNDYWYNAVDGTITQRNVDQRKWDEVNPVVWDTDPNTITDGAYWFDSNIDLVLLRIAGTWTQATNIRYEEANAEGGLDNPVANHYWFVPSTQQLFQRDATNTSFVEINVIVSFNDPTARNSCDIWWNVSPSIDTMFHWDAVNNQWDAVGNFFQSVDDPAGPPTLAAGTLWYNPSTDALQKITGVNCTDAAFIASQFDPTALPAGVIWKDTVNNLFAIWDGTEFISIDPIVSETDPFSVSDDVLWYKTDDGTLFVWMSGAWVEQSFITGTLAPANGTYFYHSIEEELYQWNLETGTWAVACGLAEVELDFQRDVCFQNLSTAGSDLFSGFNNNDDRFGRDLIRFKTCNIGCNQSIEVDPFSTVITKLNKPVIRLAPASGRSLNDTGPMYKELGVGDDGTPDERRKLQNTIRLALGAAGVTVELSKESLDQCIDNSLQMIRKYSSYSYEHVLFFMDVYPNQQRYTLTNKCVGFNKITNINVVHRMRGGFLGSGGGGFGGSDIFGYAALQQLYSTGSFDMLSFHLVSSYVEDLQYLFADQLVYDFYEDSRVLNFHQVFYSGERVLLDAHVEIPEQRLITNRYISLWIQKWAVAEAKMMLSQVRGKFTALPGPNGSTTLNSQELITQAENEMSLLREELNDRSMQDHNSDVMSQFWIG